MAGIDDAPFLLADIRPGVPAMDESDCDCDCACSPPLESVSESQINEFHEGAPLYRTRPSYELKLDDRHCLLYSPWHAYVVANQGAQALLNHYNRPRTGDRIPKEWADRWGEGSGYKLLWQMLKLGLLYAGETRQAQLSDKKTPYLAAWLQITGRCNLSCRYCYVSDRSTDMNEGNGRQALLAIFRLATHHGYQAVRLKYAGGEPLLAFDRMCQLHVQAQSLADENHFQLSGIVLSNGTLLKESHVQRLRELDMKIMISLDGMPAYHDLQRVTTKGRGTGVQVLKAIETAMNGGLKPVISVTITNETAPGLGELVEWLLGYDLHFSFNFYRENPCAHPVPLRSLDPDIILPGMLAAYQAIQQRHPERSLLSGLIDRANLAAPHRYPCGAGRHYLAVATDRRISGCPMILDQGSPKVMDGGFSLLDVLYDKDGEVINPSVDAKQDCKDCSWKYWCAGSCPLTASYATGRYDTKSPYCELYKRLIPELIRLEGYRLLKYGKPPFS